MHRIVKATDAWMKENGNSDFVSGHRAGDDDGDGL